MVRIIHFRNKCIGCNACVEANPERWRISHKDGKSILIAGKTNPKNSKKKSKAEIYHLKGNDIEYNQNKIAANNCPLKIIRVEKS